MGHVFIGKDAKDLRRIELLIEQPIVFKMKQDFGLRLLPEVFYRLAEAWLLGRVNVSIWEERANDRYRRGLIIGIAENGIDVRVEIGDFKSIEHRRLKAFKRSLKELWPAAGDKADIDWRHWAKSSKRLQAIVQAG
ncbi:hypothetical protein [Agrobacterium cavarae]|uniref:hypothetical protein n=1 Tax=Agrobacterium cavarae TaxID=2528239 RepID=UPI0028AE86C4|nr:hypothetical protein [Agrobacterium cavarae]